MEQLKSLADLMELQEIDLQIDKLLDTRSSLPELDEYKHAHEEVTRLTAELEQARNELTEIDRNLSRTNGELEITAEKAASEQNRLYAGGMSARDADYLRREVELLYGKVSKMEDQVLEYLEAKEHAEAEVERLTGELEAATANKDRLGAIISDRWKVIDKELAVKEERKKAAVALVDEYLLETYESLRESHKGQVVGPLVDGVCGVCHLKLSAAEAARVAKEDPPRCIHCRSILVV